MNTPRVTPTVPSALQWMAANSLHLPHAPGDFAGRSIAFWPSVAVAPFLALAGMATNPAIGYNAHIDPGYTNPVISLDRRAFEWPDEETGELAAFLSFLDGELNAHPEWVEPADEAQIDRLTLLLKNVTA